MGCGQSSLKGEKAEDVQSQPSQPLKKVGTNFSTVNYDTPGNQERRNTEYAPHDEVRQHKPSEPLSPLTEKKSNPIATDAAAQPGASTQPETTTATTSSDTTFANRLPGDTVGDESAPKTPYKDVTTDSPTSPVANNVSAAFPEATGSKPTQ